MGAVLVGAEQRYPISSIYIRHMHGIVLGKLSLGLPRSSMLSAGR
jgi:hypothetical protein